MTTDIQVQFSTDEGEKDYVQGVADLIRAERHDLAEDTLIAGLASLHVPLAELCLETRTNLVELTQWDTLQQMIFRPLDSDGLCTAVGLDLSNYGNQRITPGEGVEPIVEVKFYSDESFPFSVKSRDEILAENAIDGAVPWHGSRDDYATFEMDVVGLARLNSAVEIDKAQRVPRTWPSSPTPGPAPAPANYVAFRLAQWLLSLRYHRAVKHHLDREGLARHLPVIVGSHDAGPFIEAVYYAAPSRESTEEAEARMAAAWEAQCRAACAERERQLWETADSMRQMRNALRATRFWPSRRVRLLRDYYEAKEALLFRMQELGRPIRPSWKIADDAEFEQFLKQFYVDAFLKNESD